MCISSHLWCKRGDFPDTCLRTWGFTLYICNNSDSCGAPDFQGHGSICPSCRTNLQLQIYNMLLQPPPEIGGPWTTYTALLVRQEQTIGRLLALMPEDDAPTSQIFASLRTTLSTFLVGTHSAVGQLVDAAASVLPLQDAASFQSVHDVTSLMRPTTRRLEPGTAASEGHGQGTDQRKNCATDVEVSPGRKLGRPPARRPSAGGEALRGVARDGP